MKVKNVSNSRSRNSFNIVSVKMVRCQPQHSGEKPDGWRRLFLTDSVGRVWEYDVCPWGTEIGCDDWDTDSFTPWGEARVYLRNSNRRYPTCSFLCNLVGTLKKTPDGLVVYNVHNSSWRDGEERDWIREEKRWKKRKATSVKESLNQ